MKLATLALAVCMAAFTTTTFAQMSPKHGIISASKLPGFEVGEEKTLLNVPHIRQMPWLCVPTSSAMVLRYHGQKHDPRKLKRLAEQHKPRAKRNRTFTYWRDMQVALKKVGVNWHVRNYPKTSMGFERGLMAIKTSLRAGNPVLIDVHLGQGHTFVIMGYDDAKQVVYIRDPDIARRYARKISYETLRRHWHNHRFHKSRSAFFSRQS